ncbi:glutamine synthetase family protein [Geothrix sp. PMB-07]|uniref:glutamine synthetase family protein n=1 Tax=Geothrix sp. PMB-07 TaxID=3068640 RepID=UPI002740A754|nr:glutamine synthetase family protein [Geothrix sp. PMB-07]WLT32821.1 glutamine synthetase family protein [Geothrix sp. PMB-07]
MNDSIALNPNKIVKALGKPAGEFTKQDLIRYIEQNNIRMLNFRYVAGDGRLKKLNFVINSKAHLDRVLSMGERVDGSSLFPFVQAESSDLYVVPRYRTAFMNPFTEVPTIDVICSFFNNQGDPLESAPEYILQKAQRELKARTGLVMEALGELEYYLFSEIDRIYPITEQKGYHESHPFSKWGLVRREAMQVISEMGGTIKYGHAEVGNILHGDLEMVQHEIEFLPTPIEDAADQLVMAKWAIREVAYKHDLEVSFAPKIIVGHAGSGLHVHTRFMKDGVNVMADDRGLTDTARKVIAGYLMSSESLTAFGNTVPTSFLRLVPHQEAPTSICWGDRNRSVLVRVPLGWLGVGDKMLRHANPQEPADTMSAIENNQTVELRSPDGSANIHLLLAGMAVAARYGLEHPEALKVAEQLYVKADASKVASLKQLPASCFESAECLGRERARYEDGGVFPAGLIDSLIKNLQAFNDLNMSEKMFGNADSLKDLVNRHLHCG